MQSGHDSVNSIVIKEVIHAISIPLFVIIKLSLTTGIVPDSMKVARVTPNFKSGDIHLLNNYRPISIVSSFSKILERVVSVRPKKSLQFLVSASVASDPRVGIFYFLVLFCCETMSNSGQNCWIDWNSAMLCFPFMPKIFFLH